MRKVLLVTIALFLSQTLAQDGAVVNVPKGVDNKMPKDDPGKKKDEGNDNAIKQAQQQSIEEQKVKDKAKAEEEKKEEEKAKLNGEETKKEKVEEDGGPAFLKNGKPSVKLESISPGHGPTLGDTRVVVRGGPFAMFQNEHPEPKCKFGENVVGAAYVACPGRQPKAYEKEGSRSVRTSVCIQCENSPAIASKESVTVPFTVSITGDFTDTCSTNLNFFYYKPVKISAIKPTHGPKDGGTTVQVWGEGFVEYGDDTSCSFGTKSVPAKIHDQGYLTCVASPSDVVQRGMPFSVSLNGQQQSRDNVDYWYYNDPQVTFIDPDTGPEKGGNVIKIRGENFKPFRKDEGELDIANSTFCYFVALGAYRKAEITNSTRATCKAPESYYFRESAVEITLNAADRTDDGTLYHYYKPPFLFDAEPSQGPMTGGTKVKVVGSNFSDSGNITCRFGENTVPATRISSSEVQCIAPPAKQPGEVDLVIQVYQGLDSAAVSYLYYENPIVDKVYPPCGPLSGFTQIVVTGQHFVDLGRDMPMCGFKSDDQVNFFMEGGKQPVVLTNATIINQTMIICDAPSMLNKQGYPIVDPDSAYWDVGVSLDGGSGLSETFGRFDYYVDPIIKTVEPQLGPTYGGTIITLGGQGFDANSTCNAVVKLGILEVKPLTRTNETLTFRAPVSPIPGTTSISVSLNGQQFTKQPAVSDLPKEMTYDFYSPPYTSYFYPSRGPNNGGTPQRHQGYGYKLERPHLQDRFWARLIDGNKNILPGTDQEIPPERLNIDEWTWSIPPVNTTGDFLMQVSLNRQDWHDVLNPETGKAYSFYASPHITGISPSFGGVKATKDQVIELTGTGFSCSDEECADLMCRFGDTPDTYIFVKAQLGSSTMIKCKVPQYTKPDVLKVEMTINGESYTNDNHTFGFFDPFVLDANPKLLATDGSTHIQIKGLGFVDTGHTKANFDNHTNALSCGGYCMKDAKFIDKNTLNTTSFRQDEMRYSSGGGGVAWDPFYVDASVLNDEFTRNQVELRFYEDPSLKSSNIAESPANLQSQLILLMDFKNNDLGDLLRLGNPKCRFQANGKLATTEGQLVAYPFTQSRDPNMINSVHCKTPRWKLDGDQAEQAELDVSINGQQYLGNFAFTFTRELRLHRDVPMSAPNDGANKTMVSLVGQGYRLRARNPSIKWGLHATEQINMTDIRDYVYNHDAFVNSVPGVVSLKAYEQEAAAFPRVDTPLAEGGNYENATLPSQLQDGQVEGVAYLEAGLDEVLSRDAGQAPWTLYTYEPSSVEFYSYKLPNVVKMFPTAGLTKGGTFVEILGTWFAYAPEYGIVPHCRFGDKVVRAHFDSTVRLVCQAPPNEHTATRLPLEVSMNGIDWSDTGFTFAYYEEPVMTKITPDMGSIGGGEVVYIVGEKFSNNTDHFYFRCRFTPTTLQLPPKETQITFHDSTNLSCPAPGGWPEGDRMVLQITLNGVDYDQNHFQYSFYNVHRAFPRSGPSDGKGGVILVSGQGFRPDKNPMCRLNGTEHKPIAVSQSEIKCPMPPAEEGAKYFGNVDFAVSPNGESWYKFDGGFQYYQQPQVEDIDPRTGPSSGAGVINFYGEGFRADYPLAELGCMVGGAKGKAFYVSSRQIKCVVEDMPLPAEDQDSLPARVSLNSYSYTVPNERTSFRPYGVRQLTPTSGPVGGITTVVVNGQGFMADEAATPRCRFGTPANYAIVEAEILSYGRLACRTPDFLPLTPTAALPRDVPFSIALTSDENEPWTATSHKFRFYEQPILTKIEPEELEIGRIAQVTILCGDNSEFFEPMPAASMNDKGVPQVASGGTSLGTIKCRFGRFGEANAIFLNSSAISCTTPPFDESADQIYRESVTVSVALNGQDFAEDISTIEFTFVGTAPYVSFAAILMTLAAIAFLGYAIALLIESAAKKKAAAGDQ